MVKVGQRKERSDKKREVKPLIPTEEKEKIHRIAHITDKAIKDVCEFLIVFLIRDIDTIDMLSKHFKRDIVIHKIYYMGDINVVTVSKRLKGETDTVSVKFKREDFEIISALAYALDCTPTRVTAILLEAALRNVKAVNKFIYDYMTEELSNVQMIKLRKVLSYVNKQSDEIDEYSSWLTTLSTIIGDIRPATKKLYELVDNYLKKLN